VWHIALIAVESLAAPVITTAFIVEQKEYKQIKHKLS
jgi:hypothetical protein